MQCNDPKTLGTLAASALVLGTAASIVVARAPAIVHRTLDAFDPRRRTRAFVAQSAAAAVAAVCFFFAAVIAVAYAAGGLHVCR